jgi:5'(3')-deoxyribonucleotidase
MKDKLFLDFDSTIVDSITAYCRLYTYLYSDKQNFRVPNPRKVDRWDLSDECELAKDNVEEMFSNKLFFNFLDFMPDAKETILKLLEEFEIYIVTIGTRMNIRHKAKWLNIYLPEVTNTIFIHNGNCTMDKSIIDMRNGILLDDNSKNLFSSNAYLNLCFGQKKSWNADWKRIRLTDWKAVGNFLL